MLEQHQEQAKEELSLPFIEKASYFDVLATSSSKGKGVKGKDDCSTKGCFFLPPPPTDDAHTFDGWDVDALEEQFIDMKGLLRGQNPQLHLLKQGPHLMTTNLDCSRDSALVVLSLFSLAQQLWSPISCWSIWKRTTIVLVSPTSPSRVFYTANSTLSCLKWLTRCSLLKKKKKAS